MITRSSNKSNRGSSNSSCMELSGLMAEARPITLDEACDLKYLLFGNLKDTFSEAWTKQSFHFRTKPPYGFIQKRAGPCGVLAAVQAHVICELLYGESRIEADSGITKLEPGQQNEALARAITSILWQAGGYDKAIVAKKHSSIVLNSPGASDILEPDGMLEYLQLLYFECKSCLLEYFINYIPEMITDDNPSCVFLLYSVILSHGFEKFKEEMDSTNTPLIGDDGYCSQEIINLMLTGKAVPNLFNGVMELSDGLDTTVLKGIPQQSKIGLLSLYEYEGNCTVGDFYKSPVYPIWLMLAYSHFTVLFALPRDILREKMAKYPFVLYHYDGLARQHAEISFNINPEANLSHTPKDNTLPFVTRCILTRWPRASVDDFLTTSEEDKNE